MKLCPKCNKQFSDDANFCPVDAARLVPLEGQSAAPAAATAHSGDSLSSRFQLGDKLGGSRTGAVHRAVDVLGGAAAVKLIAPAVVALPGVAQRLERELKQLERVQSASVAKVLASGKRGDEAWVAYELLEGAQTLSEAITARGPIPLAQAAHLIEVVGEALIEAAQVGVVHRDLAPKNVLFAGDQVKLINFSLPVPATDHVSGRASAIPGVPEFVAPEQVDGRPVDQRSNLYSLGALYYYVLTGQTVHAGTPDEVHRAHVSGTIKTPSSLAPVPGPVEAVIMRALDRSPTKRFLTVRQFVDEVTRVARGDADPRATAPLGKAGKPKAELVQTLLGVRSGAPVIATAVLGSNANAVTVGPMAALVPQAPVLPASVQPTAPKGGPANVPPPERSPWAPPSTVPPNQALAAATPPAPAQPVAPPVVAAPVVAAPVVAAPVVAAPVAAAPAVAPPVVAKPPSGKKKSAEPETKGKFRETMWFKKGDLDAQAAVAAAEERARSGKDVQDKVDSKPIDERYNDDGSITRGDKEKYSLRTGGTQMMPQLKDQSKASSSLAKVSEDELIGEMKGGRGKVIAAIVAGVALIAIVIIWLVAK